MAKDYRPNKQGLIEIGQWSSVQAECMKVATEIARAANADDPRGKYKAEPAEVESGWQREKRAGARVRETQRGLGGLRRTLVRLTTENR